MSDSLRIIPLGGVGEVGKNITLIELDDEILVVDCGLAFPEPEMLGIDLVIPDVTYLEEHRDNVRGIILTHGHEDHTGALPYVLPKIPGTPIYATRLTEGLVQGKLREHKLLDSTPLHVVEPGREPRRPAAAGFRQRSSRTACSRPSRRESNRTAGSRRRGCRSRR